MFVRRVPSYRPLDTSRVRGWCHGAVAERRAGRGRADLPARARRGAVAVAAVLGRGGRERVEEVRLALRRAAVGAELAALDRAQEARDVVAVRLDEPAAITAGSRGTRGGVEEEGSRARFR